MRKYGNIILLKILNVRFNKNIENKLIKRYIQNDKSFNLFEC